MLQGQSLPNLKRKTAMDEELDDFWPPDADARSDLDDMDDADLERWLMDRD